MNEGMSNVLNCLEDHVDGMKGRKGNGALGVGRTEACSASKGTKDFLTSSLKETALSSRGIG